MRSGLQDWVRLCCYRPLGLETGRETAVDHDANRLGDAVAFRLGGMLAVDRVRAQLPCRVLVDLADRQIAFVVGDLNGPFGERIVGAVSPTQAHGEGFGLFATYVIFIEASYTVDVTFAWTGDSDGRYLDVLPGGTRSPNSSLGITSARATASPFTPKWRLNQQACLLRGGEGLSRRPG